MKSRHASEVAAQKTVWRQLAAEREKVWSDYRKEFATPEPQQEADQQQSHRDEFREAASGTGKPERERNADQNQGNGADRAPIPEKSPQRDWRARRSATERKADGSYKKRDRGNDDSGRSRRRNRYDHD
jgi:hypothetical protein